MKQIDRVIDHRPVHQRMDFDATGAADASKHLLRNGGKNFQRDKLPALQEPFESLHPGFDLNTIVGNGLGRFGHRNAPAIGNPDNQQDKVLHM